jgi:SAM-dependent methyltransferase
MSSCTTCNLCDRPGTLAQAVEVGKIPCHVRRFKDDLFTVWRCTGCGSLHCAEDADLAIYYSHYPLTKQTLDFHARQGYRNRLRMLKRRGFHASQRVLDYGCGTGVFIDYLRAQGAAHVSGYDAFVPRYANDSVLAESYDVVVSYDVIEHVDDPRQFMHSVARLVRPGGLLIIGTPNADHLPVAYTTYPTLGLSQPYHRHILSERMLVSLGRECGMVPEHVSHKWYFDTLAPTVNGRFISGYIEETGGFLDASFEPPRSDVVLKSPRLLFAAFFGGLFPTYENLLVSFRKDQANG